MTWMLLMAGVLETPGGSLHPADSVPAPSWACSGCLRGGGGRVTTVRHLGRCLFFSGSSSAAGLCLSEAALRVSPGTAPAIVPVA